MTAIADHQSGSAALAVISLVATAGSRSTAAPEANAYAERWIGTVRRESLDRLPILSERQLRSVLAEYATHYNGHRPPATPILDQRPPLPGADLSRGQDTSLAVQRTDILGGLIHEYRQAA